MQCHTLNYQLKRLVSDKDSQQVLQQKQTEIIDVIPNTYMYYKVVTKDILAPGKINFAYAEGQYVRAGRANAAKSLSTGNSRVKFTRVVRTKVELSAYFSCKDTNREPTKENYDKMIENPTGSITMPMIGKERFDNEHVYISLFSITGCQVHVTAYFPDVRATSINRRTVVEDFADETDFDNYLVCKNWRKQNLGRGAEKDCFIKGNVGKINDFPGVQSKR